jgi:hypothetical protein
MAQLLSIRRKKGREGYEHWALVRWYYSPTDILALKPEGVYVQDRCFL